MVDLTVDFGRLVLRNPVMNASGTYGGEEYVHHVPIDSLGAFVTKTVTREPRQGNPPPRIYETPCGMLNSIGLENMGVRRFISELLPRLASSEAKIIVSIGGNSVSEYSDVAGILSDEEAVDGLELNLSCPNVKEGGLQFGKEPKIAHRVVSAVRKATSLFVTAKLSSHSDLPEVARACRDAGCDSVTLINTLPGMAVDIVKRRSWLGNITGGLSGPAIRPVAVYWVYRITGELKIPAIGVGGIMKSEDAVEFMIAGASAIQIGTGNFVDPTAPLSVIDGIVSYCERGRIDRLSDLVGSLNLEKFPDRN